VSVRDRAERTSLQTLHRLQIKMNPEYATFVPLPMTNTPVVRANGSTSASTIGTHPRGCNVTAPRFPSRFTSEFNASRAGLHSSRSIPSVVVVPKTNSIMPESPLPRAPTRRLPRAVSRNYSIKPHQSGQTTKLPMYTVYPSLPVDSSLPSDSPNAHQTLNWVNSQAVDSTSNGSSYGWQSTPSCPLASDVNSSLMVDASVGLIPASHTSINKTTAHPWDTILTTSDNTATQSDSQDWNGIEPIVPFSPSELRNTGAPAKPLLFHPPPRLLYEWSNGFPTYAQPDSGQARMMGIGMQKGAELKSDLVEVLGDNRFRASGFHNTSNGSNLKDAWELELGTSASSIEGKYQTESSGTFDQTVTGIVPLEAVIPQGPLEFTMPSGLTGWMPAPTSDQIRAHVSMGCMEPQMQKEALQKYTSQPIPCGLQQRKAKHPSYWGEELGGVMGNLQSGVKPIKPVQQVFPKVSDTADVAMFGDSIYDYDQQPVVPCKPWTSSRTTAHYQHNPLFSLHQPSNRYQPYPPMDSSYVGDLHLPVMTYPMTPPETSYISNKTLEVEQNVYSTAPVTIPESEPAEINFEVDSDAESWARIFGAMAGTTGPPMVAEMYGEKENPVSLSIVAGRG
jgi:hypothetical protein